jgi:hypothetical protein
MGFNMQTVSWTPDNKFIVTTKNGAAMIPSLTDAFVSAFRNDQSAIDYYKTKAYLDMKDTAASNAQQFGSMEAAENDYLVRMSKLLFDENAARSQQADANYNAVQNKKGALENIITQKGIDPNNPTAKPGNILWKYDVRQNAVTTQPNCNNLSSCKGNTSILPNKSDILNGCASVNLQNCIQIGSLSVEGDLKITDSEKAATVNRQLGYGSSGLRRGNSPRARSRSSARGNASANRRGQ